MLSPHLQAGQTWLAASKVREVPPFSAAPLPPCSCGQPGSLPGLAAAMSGLPVVREAWGWPSVAVSVRLVSGSVRAWEQSPTAAPEPGCADPQQRLGTLGPEEATGTHVQLNFSN